MTTLKLNMVTFEMGFHFCRTVYVTAVRVRIFIAPRECAIVVQ